MIVMIPCFGYIRKCLYSHAKKTMSILKWLHGFGFADYADLV